MVRHSALARLITAQILLRLGFRQPQDHPEFQKMAILAQECLDEEVSTIAQAAAMETENMLDARDAYIYEFSNSWIGVLAFIPFLERPMRLIFDARCERRYKRYILYKIRLAAHSHADTDFLRKDQSQAVH